MDNLNRIKFCLVERNLSGKWLSEKLRKSTCTVSKWCSNNLQPDLKTLNAIARLLDIDIHELITSSK